MAPIVGHVGDGNFHLTLLVDMDDAEDVYKRQLRMILSENRFPLFGIMR